MNRWSPDLFNKAWNFATVAHHGQTYGGFEQGMQIDYINHIGSVAMEVILAVTSSPDCHADLAIQCALLHDVIEDTHYTFADINEQFGVEVANGVLALTKNKNLPTKQEQMRDSLARIKKQPHEVWMVKLADRITNLYHPPYYWKREKIISYREEAIVIYQELKEANTALANRLWQKIEEYSVFI